MRLLSARLEGIRNIAPLELRFGASAEPLAVTGPGGSGKTSVLEAIVAARAAFLPGAVEPPKESWVRSGIRSASIALEWELSSDEQTRARVEGPTTAMVWQPGGASTDVPLRIRLLLSETKIQYYDTVRDLRTMGADDILHPGGLLRPGRASGKYPWVERHLLELANRDARATATAIREKGIAIASGDLGALKPFADALTALSPKLRWAGSRYYQGAESAWFAKANGDEQPFDRLSESEQMAILFASSIDRLKPSDALVLIDTPELSFHPGDHWAFFDAFTKRLPRLQLLAATTSAPILRALPRQQVIVMEG